MSYKENHIIGSNLSSISVKPEPRETVITPLTRSNSMNHESDSSVSKVKPEPVDAARVSMERGLPVSTYAQNSAKGSSQMHTTLRSSVVAKDEDAYMEDATNTFMSKRTFFTPYKSHKEISFTPEGALKEGLGMVSSIKSGLKSLQLGSKLRQEVWMREIESLTSQGAPTTLIAVCGATGAGKSSVLNAILDDNIVPTSGMRACTAVVTELAYHNKPTIDADVSFLSEAEWKEELTILLTDLIDEDGNIKRSTDLKSDAGVAWSKVHAVYPNISQEQLVHMSADQIIARDQTIAKILGTTKNIIAANSEKFAKEIGKYIDSKDQKRGDKKKDKEKKTEKTVMDKVREASGLSRSKDKTVDVDVPALWPLIRQVNVRCKAAALLTGAVLVDLPGVADANAARNNIAKDYMKKCDCIWILAPITRAVDDKTARDLLGDAFKMQLMNGNYDDHTITFIASKCDDVSCLEVIRNLQLQDDAELEEIEERLESFDDETSTWKRTKTSVERAVKAGENELEELREVLAEYEEHFDALKNGKPFTSRLTKNSKVNKSTRKKAPTLGSSKKRKNTRGGKPGSSKRFRSSDIDDNESMDSHSDSDIDGYSDFGDSDRDSEDRADFDRESIKSIAESDLGGDEGEDEDNDEEVTQESLKKKIKEIKDSMKSARERHSKARKLKKNADDTLATLKKNIAETQREKNAFCSLKRSEFSKDVLKKDFRVGLKDLDDAAAEKRDPHNFNPNQNIRDYDAIDLPVFTCSSRDYVRLKGQVKGDGEPTCFTETKDTGIPDLQQWCHQLTISSRERSARNFLAHLKTFATSVLSYVQGIGEVTTADREDLRHKWESSSTFRNDYDDLHDEGTLADSDDPDPFAAILDDLGCDLGAALYSMNKPKPAPKVDEYGYPVGITPRLALEFSKLVDNCVKDLQERFKDGLEDKCKSGAADAAAAAVTTTDEFAASMHWVTYRATLRRHGSWRRDLNVELIMPFTRNIAQSWGKIFESDLFGPFEAASISSINKLIQDIENSAARGLKDRSRMQGELCLEEARVALKKTMEVVRETMNNEQKEVSRCMAPHVQTQLAEGYDRAMEERGTGSVARQRTYFRGFIDSCKNEIFNDGADVVMDRLTKAADAVGDALDGALSQLAQKIEVNLSILWQGTHDDPVQFKACSDMVAIVKTVLEHVEYWTIAQKTSCTSKTSDDAMDL
ncbi:GTPase SLIP-GC [Termitomyces sp. T112]|nr:GTPase SLIP-GC [Termitomyces sp. T112]